MNPQDGFDVVARRSPSLLETHLVLRNTYLLLSMTLFFSALMAFIALKTNAPSINPIIVLVVYMGLLFLTSALRNSPLGLVSIFAFTGFMGWTLGPMLNAYIHLFSNGAEIITVALAGTAVIFLSLSGYVLMTRKDFSFMGGFLFIGLIVVVISSIVGILFSIPGFQIAISAATLLIASGLILFDTSRIIHNGQTNYILATIELYLDIYMVFVNLLQILATFSGEKR